MIRLSSAALAAITLVIGTAGCWPGWDFLFDQTPSREHRVEDLRVLAVISEPASIVLAPAFFLAEAEPAPVALAVRPEIFDPRGGEIEVAMALCATPVDPAFGGGPLGGGGPSCVTVDGATKLAEVVVADAGAPLGRVSVDGAFELTRAQIVSIFETAGLSPTGVGGVSLGIVVNVGRTFDGKRERERAELFINIAIDPLDDTGISAAQHDELLAASFVVDCGALGLPPGTCFPGQDIVPVCGNGVVESFEQCDPPEEGVCDEACFAFDFCEAARPAICVERVTENQRPTIDGLLVEGEAIAVGGVIPITPGVPVLLAPASAAIVEVEGRQRSFSQGFCPEGSPGALPSLSCLFIPGTNDISSENLEAMNWRFYVADGRAEIVSPSDGATGVFFGNPQFEPVGITFAADTPAGTQEPLVVVLADGEGGMDLAVFTLEAR